MSTRMLIDARHSEETRVAIVKGSRVEELDYESASKRQLKGNIYLAKVTRVEPSLQAAFVDYGGNRHGFLAFSEIHPDYYQIPTEDRDELMADEAEAARAAAVEHDEVEEKPDSKPEKVKRSARKSKKDEDATEGEDAIEPSDADGNNDSEDGDSENGNGNDTEVQQSDEDDKDEEVESAAQYRRNLRAMKRRYKIQEVIKRRQVLLIQVVKEERGNKGAALTTYISLAGRYCVLMPNSTHSGGISRKISNQSDRRRLKSLISSLSLTQDMGLIIRTAGMQRTKTEIKRDCDYLLRLWNGIRELTLKSVAPACIYEEGNLIKRTIRDLYNRDIDEIHVEGEAGYRTAKDFMKLLMPSHAKKVQHYSDTIPLFHRYQVEGQLEAMYQPVVTLRSGGYIVINPTEALISIDVNSGKSTREQNIEETAYKTNLEAAEEVARQLRLRDMAGLVVIDFIDMENNGNNRSVERKMKDYLKSDRARIQVGRISTFGLMEMSRQRLRPNLIEAAMETCPHCKGAGVIRSVESAALMAIRMLEEEGIRERSALIRMDMNPDVAVYLLNQKRSALHAIEAQYNLQIEILSRSTLSPSDIEVNREAMTAEQKAAPVSVVVTPDSIIADLEEESEDDQREKAETKVDSPSRANSNEQSEDGKPKRRRRRRRRRRGEDDGQANNNTGDSEQADNAEASEDKSEAKSTNNDDGERNPRQRRRRRGGRRRGGDRANRQEDNGAQTQSSENAEASSDGDKKTNDTPAEIVQAASSTTETEKNDDTPKRPRRRRSRKKDTDETPAPENAAGDDKAEKPATPAADGNKDGEVTPKPRRGRPRKKPTETAVEKPSDKGAKEKDSAPKPAIGKASKDAPKAEPKSSPKAASEKPKTAETPAPPKITEGVQGPGGPSRKGWWQRTFG